MAKRMIIGCMDPRFEIQTRLKAMDFFELTDPLELYGVFVAGGIKTLANIAEYAGDPPGTPNWEFYEKMWELESVMNSIRVLCEKNPDKVEILLVAHLDVCKAYEHDGVSEEVNSRDSFHQEQLVAAKKAICKKFPHANVHMAVSQIVEAGMVKFEHFQQV